jgi:hypothetical protein
MKTFDRLLGRVITVIRFCAIFVLLPFMNIDENDIKFIVDWVMEYYS